MNTIEYLNLTKQKLGITSDYALAKSLEISRSGISALVNGKVTMSDETARKVAEIIGVHPGIVMLDMHRERALDDVEANIWQEIAKGFLSLLMPAKKVFS